MIDELRLFLEPHVGWLLFVMVFGLLAIRAPIGVALGLASIAVTLVETGRATSLATAVIGAMNEKFLLTAIPFFILSSAFLTSGGAAQRIVQFAISAVGHVRGGMATSGVFSCMLFAALSGSSPATVAAIGPISLKGMDEANYPLKFGAGVITTAGTLGSLSPPSIVMVVYAASTNESVGKMFIAGVIPGLLAGLSLMIGIWFAVGALKIAKRDWVGWRILVASGYQAFFGILLIVLVLGGIYQGFFTPTEAAAFAAVYGFVTATVIYRGIGFMKDQPWRRDGESVSVAVLRNTGLCLITLPLNLFHKDIRKVLLDAAIMSVMLMFIIFNALMFSHVLTELEIPKHMADSIAAANLQPWLFLVILNIMLLIGGQFMEPSGLLLIVAPILHPIALSLDIDPIHLGIIMVVNMEIGMVTPPVGLNLFVMSSITGMGILEVVRAALPWTGILFLFLILITYVPQISLFLPELLY